MLSLISGIGVIVPEQKWLNVMEFSSYYNFPDFLGQPRTPKSFEIKIPEMSVPFAHPHGNSAIFCRMESTSDSQSNTWMWILVDQYSAYCQ